tara:strand:+ start:595 stop:897 length:303 start_codon:yes stop_codon:yes gene_type:complete
MDLQAIIKAYPNAAYVDETVVKDASGNVISTEQSKIDAARVELDKLNYQLDRTINGTTIYAPTGEQMAMIYDDIIAGKLDATGSFAIHNKAVKDANPKPS